MTQAQEMFYGLYARKLAEAVAAQPKRYAYSIGEIDFVAKRMTRMLAQKTGLVSPTVRAVCVELGVQPNAAAIAAFLNSKAN